MAAALRGARNLCISVSTFDSLSATLPRSGVLTTWSHSQVWETHGPHVFRDNCLTNTDRLQNVFAIEAVPRRLPLYVAGELRARDTHPDGEPHARGRLRTVEDDTALRPLLAAGYDIVTKDALLPGLLDQLNYTAARDVLAAVDYLVCAAADTFVGNSVSTFSAHLILGDTAAHSVAAQRRATHVALSSATTVNNAADYTRPRSNGGARAMRRLQPREAPLPPPPLPLPVPGSVEPGGVRGAASWPRRSFHYNGGDNPLQAVLLGADSANTVFNSGAHGDTGGSGAMAGGVVALKWVFAINGETDAYDEMTQAAVLSALRATDVVPVCIYYGPTSPPPPIYHWLEVGFSSV